MLKTIMLIDDSAMDMYLTSAIVERAGIAGKSLKFESAQAALAHLRGPDGGMVEAILLDINMPVMDGFAFLDAYEKVRAQGGANALVVMLTSSPDQVDRDRATSYASVCGYVVKPLGIDAARALAARVEQAANEARHAT